MANNTASDAWTVADLSALYMANRSSLLSQAKRTLRNDQDATEVVQEAGQKEKEHWMNSKWRPMMGWMYMVICMFDFLVAPVLWSLLQAMSHGQVTSQWQPVTLQGAGLFHMAMGAVLGVAAYGRTKEKVAGAA